MRSTDEWIGKNDDSKVPDRVRMRIFYRHGGKCHISNRRIEPSDSWDADHIIPLCNGGEHRESNLAPALREKHRAKTAVDVALKAKNDRVRKRHIGIKKPRTIRAWRRFDGTIVYADRNR